MIIVSTQRGAVQKNSPIGASARPEYRWRRAEFARLGKSPAA
jgi:hypothetical protein